MALSFAALVGSSTGCHQGQRREATAPGRVRATLVQAPMTPSTELASGRVAQDQRLLPFGQDEAIRMVAHQSSADESATTIVPADQAFEPAVVTDPTGAFAQALTLEQITSLALSNNPAIRQAEAAVAKANGLRYQVGLRPNPMVGYNATQLADRGTDQHTMFVEQDFITAQKLQRNTNVLGFEVENLKWQAEQQRRTVLADVKVLFYETLGAQQQLELSKQFVDMAEKAVDVSRQRKKAGEGTEVDVLQSEVQLQQVTVANRQAIAAVIGAWTRLTATIGQPNMQRTFVEGQLPSEPVAYQWDAEYSRICSESPELMAALTRVSRARANLDRQSVQATPNISWMFGAGYDNGTDSQMINTQVGIPLPINNQNEGNQSAAQAEYCRALQEVRRIELSIKSRLAVAAQSYDSSAASVSLYRTEVIPKAEKMLELAEITFKAGEIDFLQVLTIRRTYFDSMFAYLTARTDLA
ncbi:MAG: TolC family protein, partial [Pirellulaceae bacterium]|nr:TolC family protein [Pirellulaceae bacterium]